MEVSKKRKSQPCRTSVTSLSKGSSDQMTSIKGRETQKDEDKNQKRCNGNKRKGSKISDEAVSPQKLLKQEKIESIDKVVASKKMHVPKLKTAINSTCKESALLNKKDKGIKSTLSKSHIVEQSCQESTVKEEKLLANASSKAKFRSRKKLIEIDGEQGEEVILKHKSKGKTQDNRSSSMNITKEGNEVKNAKIKNSYKVGAKRKIPTGKAIPQKNRCKGKAAERQAPIPEINVNDPMAMLMMMEGGQGKQHVFPTGSQSEAAVASLNFPKPECANDHSLQEMQDSGDSDWEDVKDHTLPPEEEHSQIPTEPVQITLDLPDILNKKRKKKAFDWKEHLEKQMRKFKREVAINIHKAHILCLIAHGLQQNSILNDETVKGLTLSRVPVYLNKSAKACLSTDRVVDSAMSWYRKAFPLDRITHTSGGKLVSVDAIANSLSKSVIADARLWVYVSENADKASFSSSKASTSSKGNVKATNKATSTSSHTKPSAKKPTKQSSSFPPQSEKLSPSTSASPLSSKSSTSPLCSKASSSSSLKSTKKLKLSADTAAHRSPSVRRSSLEARMKAKKTLKEESSEEDVSDGKEKMKPDKKLAKQKVKNVIKKGKSWSDSQENSDSDFEASPCFDHNRQELKIKSNRKILSDDDGDDSNHGKAHDFWLEVFVENKKQWTCFDCFKNVYNKPYSLEMRATQPVCYVVAFKNDNGIKDVTARYAKQWFSQTRKQRVNADWLEETFGLFTKATYSDTVIEEDQIKSQLMVRPMPSTVSDFKNHPLYALRRHLLKFEAIYPETAIPLGYVRKEPVYARECVHTLHSRDNWLKEGRLVRLREEPYKMVKSRPKWNKPKENPEELDLELYGEWQTEIYIPPPAVNGKVPKNEYGNVELFKPWMLPTGTVQLKLQSLQRVAKKLNIDVAPAMVGWDHHSGHAHPVFDGFIVCKEFADTLLDAWDEDQEIQKQKDDEKREKRVYGNWRLLIRGLLIKERLKIKFLQDPLLMEMGEAQALQGSSKAGESAAGSSSGGTILNKQKDVEGREITEIKNKSTIPTHQSVPVVAVDAVIVKASGNKEVVAEIKSVKDSDKDDFVTDDKSSPNTLVVKEKASATKEKSRRSGRAGAGKRNK